jgi:DNA repair exonuclease SbcCD ATPase subunit
LYVERFDERSGEYVLQQVKTLSTSEKSAIALILQIALKQMYIPDLDFLILDDVLGNFDEDKKIKILDYLSNKAREEDWYIILTTLTDEDRPLEIKAW